MKTGNWEHSFALDPEGSAGFIYLIVNLVESRLYVGRKFYKVRKGKSKGTPHVWKNYQSSSKELQNDIKRHGKENFKFYIIEEYKSYGGLSWAEVWSLCHVRVPEENHLWYNRRIDKVSWKSTEKVSERHKRRLNYLVSKYSNKRKKK